MPTLSWVVSADVVGECSDMGLVTTRLLVIDAALVSGQRVLAGMPVGFGDAGKSRSAVGCELERMYP